MKNFKELKIWQKGFKIAKNSFQITSSLPNHEKFGLGDQIIRAAISIPSNIAEGSSRSSDKDYNRFVEISLGSSFELETQLLIAKEIDHGNQILITETFTDLEEEEKMITAFSHHLKSKNN